MPKTIKQLEAEHAQLLNEYDQTGQALHGVQTALRVLSAERETQEARLQAILDALTEMRKSK